MFLEHDTQPPHRPQSSYFSDHIRSDDCLLDRQACPSFEWESNLLSEPFQDE